MNSSACKVFAKSGILIIKIQNLYDVLHDREATSSNLAFGMGFGPFY
jgi:hypothetical protein